VEAKEAVKKKKALLAKKKLVLLKGGKTAVGRKPGVRRRVRRQTIAVAGKK